MGRYYSGDIEGKFWFGVQSSDDASFFGGIELEPNYINYYFDESDLPDIEEGLEECKKNLGDALEKFEKFFSKATMYNNEMLANDTEYSEKEISEYLKWYARYLLGKQIYDKVKEQRHCEFQAEL